MKGKKYRCKKCTDEREVDYHRVGRIRSEFAAGWKMKGVIFDKKEYRCKGIEQMSVTLIINIWAKH